MFASLEMFVGQEVSIHVLGDAFCVKAKGEIVARVTSAPLF